MNNFENLYSVVKNFLPLAENYLKGSPLEPYLPQLQGVIDMIESVGGIGTISNLMTGLSKQTNSSNNNPTISNFSYTSCNQSISTNSSTNTLKSIDSYARI